MYTCFLCQSRRSRTSVSKGIDNLCRYSALRRRIGANPSRFIVLRVVAAAPRCVTVIACVCENCGAGVDVFAGTVVSRLGPDPLSPRPPREKK